MELIERETFYICGYVVETDAIQNDNDISNLYSNFFSERKNVVLQSLPGSKKGYYGLSWYSQGHEKYCYLLGIEFSEKVNPPQGAVTKTLEKALFAKASYPKDKNIIEAWNEFYYRDIPSTGYAPNEPYNLYFEYYPDDVHGDF